ncbi:ferredoxin reductase family protein [Demequina lignilytica]|uniref:Ferredoxin reductase family protein n=1 Tax=Demequina lignilytica TaxID=3051663 RepID=A0AB35MJ42_9MICO|nr:ferredoxin reductase family protein [Demequina sp. SYSU T0a273]MDN4483742.1 ferredoxin reductase family protein [Demequina sp. SYSU T0a273]
MTHATYARRQAARSWWRDGLEGSIYLLCAIGIAFAVADGALLATSALDGIYAAGRLTGIVAAILVLVQMTLISRAPFVERAFGHDRVASVHTRLGKPVVILMLLHAGIITVVSAQYDGRSVLSQSAAFWELGWFMVAAQAALGIFVVIAATSLVAVRRRWRYERWHAVHLLVYAGVATAVPHQFLEGSTFRDAGAAWWFWLALYVLALGSFLLWRVVVPAIRTSVHGLKVASVEPLADGSTSIVLAGRGLDRLRARPGQFMLWRFLDRERWTEAHPYSLSRAPEADTLRLTVKPSGDHSRGLAALRPGTRVVAEGPLGVFTEDSAHAPGAVLVAAGIGITPMRALLEGDDAPAALIYRVRSRSEAPLLDEVAALTAERGVALHVVEGPRASSGWGTAAGETLASLVTDVADRDVYVCGPPAWTARVRDDARAAGVPRHAIHEERFGW